MHLQSCTVTNNQTFVTDGDSLSLSCHGSSRPTHWTYNDEVVTIGCEPSQLENIHIYYCFSSSTDFNIIVQMVTMDDASGVWSCVCGLEQASTTIFKYGTLSKIVCLEEFQVIQLLDVSREVCTLIAQYTLH